MTTLQREGLSKAYVMAVASIAGFQTSEPGPDNDGIDWTIAAPGVRGTVRSPQLDVQVKAHGAAPLAGDRTFALKQRNYELLIGTDWHVPRILVVMIQDAADEPSAWMDLDDEQLVIRHCAYWVSLAGEPPTDHQHTTSVTLPRAQRFSPASLTTIMSRIADRSFP